MKKSQYKAQKNRQKEENKALVNAAGYMKIMNLLARFKV